MSFLSKLSLYLLNLTVKNEVDHLFRKRRGKGRPARHHSTDSRKCLSSVSMKALL